MGTSLLALAKSIYYVHIFLFLLLSWDRLMGRKLRLPESQIWKVTSDSMFFG